MLIQYWSVAENKLHQANIYNWEALLALIQEAANCSPDVEIPAIELIRSDGVACAFIQTRDKGCTIAVGSGDTLFWPAEFIADETGFAHYNDFGSWSEIPQRVMIPRAQALQAVKEFLETGEISPETLWLVQE